MTPVGTPVSDRLDELFDAMDNEGLDQLEWALLGNIETLELEEVRHMTGVLSSALYAWPYEVQDAVKG